MIKSSSFPSLLFSVLLAFLLVTGSLLCAAEEKRMEFPAVSQHGWVKQRVGLTDVEVDYSRPNKNDREIYGGLVPYGKLWRTGANAPTKIKFSGAVKLGDKESRPVSTRSSPSRQRTSGPSLSRRTRRWRTRPHTSRRTMRRG